MNIDSIIFDLDGTLWNVVEGVCGVWKTVLSKYPKITKIVTPKETNRLKRSKIIKEKTKANCTYLKKPIRK